MKALLTAKVGTFLVVSSVLAVWTLLAAQHVQAHTLTDPSCSGLPTVEGFFTDPTIDLASNTLTTTTKPGTGGTSGNTNYHYAKITVPALTAGELTVSTTTAPSEAILCGRQEGSVSDLPSYTSAHNSAALAADKANNAKMTAETAATAAGVTGANFTTAKNALNAAGGALTSAETALRAAETALRTAGETLDADIAKGAADTAKQDATNAKQDATDATDAAGTVTPLGTAGGRLEVAAMALDVAADALDTDMGFRINTLISSGDEEYVVVVTIPADDTSTPQLTVTFEGVMSMDATAPAGGSFTSPNQRDTHTLTANVPGLLTVNTTGSAVKTIGTLNDGTDDIAMDEGSGGNFEIVSPMDDDPAYSVFVDGQTRNEMGDYGLEVEFRVATDLANAATSDTTVPTQDSDPPPAITHGADYFFFTVPATTYRFLTVQTEKPTDVTTATNTTGTLFSTKGVVNTDTDSGFGTNFLIRAPISPGDYIVEVKGSTGGKYALSLASEAATPPTSAITGTDEIAGSATNTNLVARGVAPYSINVTKPGTLQLKTTGTADTYGVLYGPDGKKIAEDNDSGEDMNFLITQAVDPGQHIVTVEGYKVEMVSYTLVVNFVESVVVGTTNQVAELEQARDNALADLAQAQMALDDSEDEVDALRDQVAPVTVDAMGNLGNPPNDGVVSGIGVISGWVCAANEVEIRISASGFSTRRLNAAYGTTRADTVEECDDNSPDTGFGMTYNFNHLPEGTYTIGAYADGTTLIGSTRTFEVVHLVDFATADLAPFNTSATDRFLRGLAGECRVKDFPESTVETTLKWEQSVQNFVITEVVE